MKRTYVCDVKETTEESVLVKGGFIKFTTLVK